MFLSPRLVSTNVKIKICRIILVLVLYGRKDGLLQPRTIIHSVCEVHLGRRKGELQKEKKLNLDSPQTTRYYNDAVKENKMSEAYSTHVYTKFRSEKLKE